MSAWCRAWKNGRRRPSPNASICFWKPWAWRRPSFAGAIRGNSPAGRSSAWESPAAADPPLLLFDEPFGALDPITRFELQRHFLDLRRSVRKTALFVTHDVREALMLASRIALLKDGALDLLLTPREFLAASTPEAAAFLASLQENWRQDEPPTQL
jgi:hypothetical protein